MNVEPGPDRITRTDATHRVKRFASLRAAQRALAPSLRTPITAEQLEEAQYLRLRIQRLLTDVQAVKQGAPTARSATLMPAEAELAVVDSQLDRIARELIDQLQDTKVTQLRATLSAETAAGRTEAAALLDVCLESEPVPDKFLHYVDYLVTLLSIAWREDRWVMVTDPADVSERVRQRCWAASSIDRRFEVEVINQFSEAVQQLQRGEDVAGIMKEMTAVKAANAEFLFIPDFLRCVVGYNVVVRNRYDSAIHRVRERDRVMDRETLQEGEEALRDPSDALGSGSVSGAVEKIHATLRRQIAGGAQNSPEGGPIAEIAIEFQRARVGAAERMAFEHSADDGLMNTVRRTVLLGFLQRFFEPLQKPLQELGIDRAGLTELIQAFGSELQSEINGLLIENSYGSARQLSEIRATHLSGPASSGGEKGDGAPFPSIPQPKQGRARRSRAADGPATLPHPGMDASGAEPSGPLRRHAWLVPAAALGLILLFQGSPSGLGTVEPMSRARLQVISRLLQSGYRDYREDRAIFVGTLNPDWAKLPKAGQKRATDRIHSELRRKGVYEVLLYDETLDLQAHYIDSPRSKRRRWGSERTQTSKG